MRAAPQPRRDRGAGRRRRVAARAEHAERDVQEERSAERRERQPATQIITHTHHRPDAPARPASAESNASRRQLRTTRREICARGGAPRHAWQSRAHTLGFLVGFVQRVRHMHRSSMTPARDPSPNHMHTHCRGLQKQSKRWATCSATTPRQSAVPLVGLRVRPMGDMRYSKRLAMPSIRGQTLKDAPGCADAPKTSLRTLKLPWRLCARRKRLPRPSRAAVGPSAVRVCQLLVCRTSASAPARRACACAPPRPAARCSTPPRSTSTSRRARERKALSGCAGAEVEAMAMDARGVRSGRSGRRGGKVSRARRGAV